MKKAFFALSVSILVMLSVESCGPARDAEKEEDMFKKSVPVQTFSVVSINARHHLQDKTSVRKFADWVKSLGADVVAIQQIERPRNGNDDFDAAMELSKRLDMRMYFGPARYYKGFDSGNALFSPYPIQQTNLYQLPTGKGKVRRSMVFGVIDTGLRGVGFFSTELDDETLSERIKQAYEIMSVSDVLKDYPLVVAGLFGEQGYGKTAAKMNEKYTLANTVSEDAKSAEQHIYSLTQSTLKPLTAKKVSHSSSGSDGLFVTFEIQH